VSGYIVRKVNNKHQVHKRSDSGQPVGPPLGKHRTRSGAVDHMRQLYSNDDRNMKSARPTDPDDYAVVPDPKSPSTWKMPIHNREHLGLAIAAMGSSATAPHGHAAKLTDAERKQAVSRIRAKIGKLANDDADASDLRDRLEGKKYWGDGDAYPDMDGRPYASTYGDDGDDYVGDVLTPKFDPDDPRVQYSAMGGGKSGACATCAFFDADDSACRLVCGDIVPTGWCDLWLRELTPDEEDDQTAMPVRMVESKEIDEGETYVINKRGFMDMVKSAIKQLFGPDDADKPMSGFKLFGDNNEYWVAFYSNNAQDRDGEWFSEKSHDDFIARADRGEVPMPYLDFWHSKAYHGQAQWLGREGHVVIAVGTFDDSELAQEMKEYYASAQPDELLTSFGYFYPRSALVDHVYHAYNAFEVSPLPAEVAANLHTGFTSLEDFKEIETMDAKKQQALARLVGPKAAQLIASAGEQRSKELDTVETSFKATVNPLEARLDAMAEAIGLLASAKDAKSNPGVTPKTGKQGQPTTEEAQDDEPADDVDEEDLDNIGSPKSIDRTAAKQIARLEKQVKQLTRMLKAKASDPDDDEDDDTDAEDDTDDDMPPAKKSRRVSSSEKALRQIANGYKSTTDAITAVATAVQAIQAAQNKQANSINALAQEIYNPTPASRSPYTVVPPSDPAMDALEKAMHNPNGQGMAPNGQQQQYSADQLMQTFGLPTTFTNGNHRS